MSLFVTTSKYSISICISIILHFSLIPIAFADPCALLFLSSTTHRGNLVGPDGADSLCTGMYNTSGFLAKYKSLLDASQFSARHFAWVTDSSGSPRPLRIAPLVSAASPLCVINPLGAVLHSNLSQLLTPEGGELVAAHNVDQLGTVVAVDPVANNGAKVWTGSRGTQVSDCGQWTSSAPTQFGFAGDFTSAVQWGERQHRCWV